MLIEFLYLLFHQQPALHLLLPLLILMDFNHIFHNLSLQNLIRLQPHLHELLDSEPAVRRFQHPVQ